MQERYNLNDLEVAKIEAFCADEAMHEAVKKVLFAVVYSEGIVKEGEKVNTKNGAFSLIANVYSKGDVVSNEVLGAGLRAKFEGVHTILDGFENLKNIKAKIPSPYKEENEAI